MTRLFLLNLFLAIVYVALTGEVTVWNFVAGFVLGYLVLSLVARAMGESSYAGKVLRLISFLGYFLVKLVKTNVEVAWEILTPRYAMTPRILRYPVADLTPGQLTTLANAISLTPGTLTTDVDDEGHYLYVHCMYAADREEMIREIDRLKQRMIREVFR